MLTSPSAPPDERRLSAVDAFCLQTYQPAGQDPVWRVRRMVFLLGFISLALLAALGLAVSRGNAMELERDALARELSQEREAHTKASLAARDIEREAANNVLEAIVRRDIVDERMVEQERRSVELGQLAEKVEQEKLVRADCVTPRSILGASNL